MIQSVVRVLGNLHIGLLDTDETDGETLQLTTRQVTNVAVRNLVQL
jgi:hypothetical protein